MKTHKLKPLTVTIGKYYLDTHKWAFKLMGVIKLRSGLFKWRTIDILLTHTTCSKLSSHAIEYALDKNLVFISNLKQGSIVSNVDSIILEKHYGLCLSEIIV